MFFTFTNNYNYGWLAANFGFCSWLTLCKCFKVRFKGLDLELSCKSIVKCGRCLQIKERIVSRNIFMYLNGQAPFISANFSNRMIVLLHFEACSVIMTANVATMLLLGSFCAQLMSQKDKGSKYIVKAHSQYLDYYESLEFQLKFWLFEFANKVTEILNTILF